MYGLLYETLFKPLAFRRDPEDVHDAVTRFGAWLGRHAFTRAVTRVLFSFQHPALEQTIAGIHFKNPIGLAAGFDKNALLTDILPAVGFGFMEVGSITAKPCAGNPKPRLWRHAQEKSLRVYYGLKNNGSEEIARRLSDKKFAIPLGISIAQTNDPSINSCAAGIDDYLTSYKQFFQIGDYYTVNISCPNSYGGQSFLDPNALELLLRKISQNKNNKPIFLKLSPDIPEKQIDRIISVAEKYRITGFICTNLTKKDVEKGGMSGKKVQALSTKMVSYIYQKTGGRFVIIGCGGVFTAEDAYEKIRAGASLIQMITGMIFEGPSVIGDINRGLVKFLKRDGFNSISEAVGALHR